jgi:histidinol-phosphatase (PHP family)
MQQTQAGLPLETLSRQFDDFLDEAERLKTLYASRITILVGLETEFITTADLDGLEQLLEKHHRRIEYIVGSVHHVNAIPIDFDLPTFHIALNSFPAGTGDQENEQQGQLLLAYLDAQYDVLRRFRPELVGHIDLCRLYTPGLRFSDFPNALERLERNVRFAISYGALFEANAAAFRKGWETAYPGDDVVKASLPIALHLPLSCCRWIYPLY